MNGERHMPGKQGNEQASQAFFLRQSAVFLVNCMNRFLTIFFMHWKHIFKRFISIKPARVADLPIENNTNPRPAGI
jgi:hypothetical protein